MRLYIADVRLALKKPVDEYLKLLTPLRAETARKMKVESAKMRYICAGLLLREAFGCESEPELNEYGKPYYPGKDAFSISHSGDYAVLAVGGASVGADIEKLRNADFKVAKRFFHPDELICLQNSLEPGPDFTRIWTHKESFLKALGTGLSLRPGIFCIPPPGKPLLCAGSEWYFTEIPLHGYFLTLCDKDKKPEPEIIEYENAGLST